MLAPVASSIRRQKRKAGQLEYQVAEGQCIEKRDFFDKPRQFAFHKRSLDRGVMSALK